MKAIVIRALLLSSLCFAFGSSLYARTVEVMSPKTEELYKVSVLTEEELEKHFNYLATRSTINYEILFDGCFERTYMMISISRLKNIELGKLVVDVVNKKEEVIEVKVNGGEYVLRWYYHVAPLVYVETSNGNIEARVIDPGLFDHAVSIEEFKERLTRDNPSVEVKTLQLPKYVANEDQRLDKINIGALDRRMNQSRMEIFYRAKQVGNYHEKEPMYDTTQEKWYLGGIEVPAPIVEGE